MTEAQLQLISILGNQLFDAQEEFGGFTAGQRRAVLAEARSQAVFPIAFGFLERGMSEDDVFPICKKKNDTYAIINASNLLNHSMIHQLLMKNSVPYVILKGQASARYYPDPMLRTMGDVDFLINIKDRERVGQLLEEEGFSKCSLADMHSFHWKYSNGKTSVELHWDVPGIPKAGDGIIRSFLSDLIEKRELVTVSDYSFYAPSAFHHGIVLLLHAICHISSTGIGLRHLCDWLVFEESIPEEVFSEVFLEALRKMGILTFAQVLTKIGVLYFGCSERQWCMTADENLCADLLEDILAGGNFGQKDKNRRSQAMLFRNRKTRKITRSDTLRNVFENVRLRAEFDYPVCKSLPILSPCIWSIVVVQYLYRVACGKKYNMLNRKHISEAMWRQSIYEKLKLFD